MQWMTTSGRGSKQVAFLTFQCNTRSFSKARDLASNYSSSRSLSRLSGLTNLSSFDDGDDDDDGNDTCISSVESEMDDDDEHTATNTIDA
jgi:hypothetical protein